ncbi:MAG: type II CAAX endopeptidase family protein, partial [Phycisphaeraceae bacterium]
GGPGEPGGPGVRVQAVWLLVVQVVSQGAVLGYLAWRVMMEPGRPGGLRRLGVWPRGVWVEWRDGLVGLAAAMPLVLGTLVLMGWVGELIGQPAPSVGHELLLTMASTDDAVGLALLVVAVVVVAPFFEEVIFRGLVQTTLLSVLGPGRRWVIVGVSAAGFAMIHAGAATFGGEGAGGVPWHALPGLAVLGVVLGWLYEKTGSLWPAVIVHAGFNGYNVAAVLTGVAGG